MSDNEYLKRLFQAYYKENRSEITYVSRFEQREFGYIPWDNQIIMNRHLSFQNHESLIKYLIEEGPRHVYSSGALYLKPDNTDMDNKIYQGCDLIIDIDVDHFYTPCKEDHDLWICNSCGKEGTGMPKKCPNCGKLKLKTINWICTNCLDVAKNEIFKLIYNFLIPDFGINLDQTKIAFSGHRGYHLKIENEDIRTLSSEERREISNYLSGEHISFEILGWQKRVDSIFGPFKDNIGWTNKIMKKIEDFLKKPYQEIHDLLGNKNKFNFNESQVKAFLNLKEDILGVLNDNSRNTWPSYGFGVDSWYKFLKGIVHEIGVEIDIPVTIDIHRLIRYPGSLHGKTGFRAQEIYPDELDDFNPLDEAIDKLDPIVFKSNKSQKLIITESKVPLTKIKGESYGPYNKDEIIEVPHHIAVFLLCKEVAKTI